MIKEALSKLSVALFPKRCALCGEIIEYNQYLCEECEALEFIKAPLCLKCGCSKRDCICKKSKRSPEYNGVTAPYYYAGSVAHGVLNMKMHNSPELSVEQGKRIAIAVKENFSEIGFDSVTYIPMRKADENKRGFNQAKLLAECVSQGCNIPIEDLLVKKRKTKMQKRQSAKDRFINMYGVFDLAENADVMDKTILLVDDVKTTGSTLSSATLTLKAYGAKRVYCAVYAIVNRDVNIE